MTTHFLYSSLKGIPVIAKTLVGHHKYVVRKSTGEQRQTG